MPRTTTKKALPASQGVMTRLRSRRQLAEASTSNEIATLSQEVGSSRPSEQTSSAVFDSARINAITGGEFNQVTGQQTNLLINVHPGSHFQLDTGRRTAGVVASSHTASEPSSSQQSPRKSKKSRRRRRKNNANVTNNESPSQKPNEIYERHLIAKKRGFPLWIPECNLNLPIEKQRKGICIGDVGLITSAGGFSFLFNITLPIDHPFQPQRMPQDYERVDAFNERDILTLKEFKPRSSLASVSVKEILSPDISARLGEQVFQSTAAEGAILTLPNGAVSSEMESVGSWRRYMAAHIQSWYSYVNGTLGREAQNGDIRLVVGCDKTSSWGMAAATKQVLSTQPHELRFRAVSAPDALVKHVWECTGVVDARTGPSMDEIQQLSADDSQATHHDHQCVFIRTLNATLNDDAWNKIHNPDGASLNLETESGTLKEGSSSTSTADQARGSDGASSTPTGYSHIMSWTGTRSYAHGITEDPQLHNHHYTDNHPSDLLNGFLLYRNPEVEIAITSDHDWLSIIGDSEEAEFLCDDNLLCGVLLSNQESVTWMFNTQLKLPDSSIERETALVAVLQAIWILVWNTPHTVGLSGKANHRSLLPSQYTSIFSDFSPFTSSPFRRLMSQLSEVMQREDPIILEKAADDTQSSSADADNTHTLADARTMLAGAKRSTTSTLKILDQCIRVLHNVPIPIASNHWIRHKIYLGIAYYDRWELDGANNDLAAFVEAFLSIPAQLSGSKEFEKHKELPDYNLRASDPSPAMSKARQADKAPEGRLYTYQDQLRAFQDAYNLPMDNAGEFVPQNMYRPHTTSDRKRYAEEVLLDPPLYFYSEHPAQCGISLTKALFSRTKNLQDANMVVFENCGPSVTIRLEWPGYKPWSQQIPTKDFRSPLGPITLAKLAQSVAKCVKRFMASRLGAPTEAGADPSWSIGSVQFSDLVLVSLHHVSLGSWQPQLRLSRQRSAHFRQAPMANPIFQPKPSRLSPPFNDPAGEMLENLASTSDISPSYISPPTSGDGPSANLSDLRVVQSFNPYDLTDGYNYTSWGADFSGTMNHPVPSPYGIRDSPPRVSTQTPTPPPSPPPFYRYNQ